MAAYIPVKARIEGQGCWNHSGSDGPGLLLDLRCEPPTVDPGMDVVPRCLTRRMISPALRVP